MPFDLMALDNVMHSLLQSAVKHGVEITNMNISTTVHLATTVSPQPPSSQPQQELISAFPQYLVRELSCVLSHQSQKQFYPFMHMLNRQQRRLTSSLAESKSLTLKPNELANTEDPLLSQSIQGEVVCFYRTLFCYCKTNFMVY